MTDVTRRRAARGGRAPARGERRAAARASRGASGCAARRVGRPAGARLRARRASVRGDLAAGDAARHRPLRRHGGADRRRARPSRRRSRTSSTPRSTRASTSPRWRARCCPTAPTCSRPRSRRGVQSFIRDRIDGVHALAALPGPLDRGQPARAHADRRAARGRALEAARARRRHGLPRPLARGRPRQDRAAGARADADRERDPAERRRARSSSSSRRRWSSAQSGVRLLKAVAIVLPLLALLCLAGSVFARAAAAARAAARGDRRRAGDAAAGRGARASPARPTSTRSARARCRATRRRTSSTRSWRSCATACGSSSIAAVVLALVSFLVGLPLRRLGFASAS